MSLQSNTVNPTFRLMEAGALQGALLEWRAEERWRKRRPLCNGADRGEALPRKRADFQQVVRYERTGRTFIGGNRK
jgi:hypothetical protein